MLLSIQNSIEFALTPYEQSSYDFFKNNDLIIRKLEINSNILSVKKIMHRSRNQLTELFAEVLRDPLTEASALITDRLRFWRYKQRLNLNEKWQRIKSNNLLRGGRMIDRKQCVKCKQVKDSVGPKILTKVKRPDGAEALATKILCDECYEEPKK